MDIVIIANFCGDFREKSNSRFLYLANLLAKDNSVEVISSDFFHGDKTRISIDKEKYSYNITLLHEPSYAKNVSIKRFFSHYSWGKKVQEYLRRRRIPDVIYCAVPTLTAAYYASNYCKSKHIPFIIDVQDLWPEAFIMIFDIPVISDVLFFPFLKIENIIFKRADAICAVSNSYVDRVLAVNRNCKTGESVYLGTDFSLFDVASKIVSNGSTIKKCEDDIWLGYCGSMSDSYDLICVIDALSKIEHAPLFIAMGDGARKSEFEEYAKRKNVRALFLGRLSYEEMCSVLRRCDMVINPIKGKSAASIINKHGDYAASGLPVINTQDSNEYRNLVDNYNMGFNCKNGDAIDVADKIRILLDNPQLRTEMGINARKCGDELFDRRKTYIKLKKQIVNAVNGEQRK